MLLSKPQNFILLKLREYGGLQIEQIIAFLKIQYGDGVLHAEPMIHQLIQGGLAERRGNLILAAGCNVNIALLQALNIMLLLSVKDIGLVQRGTEPFLLTFFKQKDEKLYRYDIVDVAEGKEPIVCARLEDINHKYRIIIFMLEKIEQQAYLKIGCEHCFAVKENDVFQFYK